MPDRARVVLASVLRDMGAPEAADLLHEGRNPVFLLPGAGRAMHHHEMLRRHSGAGA